MKRREEEKEMEEENNNKDAVVEYVKSIKPPYYIYDYLAYGFC